MFIIRKLDKVILCYLIVTGRRTLGCRRRTLGCPIRCNNYYALSQTHEQPVP